MSQKKAKAKTKVRKSLTGIGNTTDLAILKTEKSPQEKSNKVWVYVAVVVGVVGVAAVGYWVYTEVKKKEEAKKLQNLPPNTVPTLPAQNSVPTEVEQVPVVSNSAPASPTPTTQAAYDLYANFTAGKFMPEVKLLQKFLQSKGSKIKADGKYGPNTKNAVALYINRPGFNQFVFPKNLKEAGEMNAAAKSYFYNNGIPWIYVAP